MATGPRGRVIKIRTERAPIYKLTLISTVFGQLIAATGLAHADASPEVWPPPAAPPAGVVFAPAPPVEPDYHQPAPGRVPLTVEAPPGAQVTVRAGLLRSAPRSAESPQCSGSCTLYVPPGWLTLQVGEHRQELFMSGAGLRYHYFPRPALQHDTGKLLSQIGGGVFILGLAGMGLFSDVDNMFIGSALVAAGGIALIGIGIPLYLHHYNGHGTVRPLLPDPPTPEP